MGCTDCELSILLTDDREIHKLNLAYRGKDKPTDVLSFPLDEDAARVQGMLGDVVISLPTAKRQARALKVSPREELLRLLVHGTLHLLGYDHENVPARTAARMRKTEERMLSALLTPR